MSTNHFAARIATGVLTAAALVTTLGCAETKANASAKQDETAKPAAAAPMADHPYCLYMLQGKTNGDRIVQSVRTAKNGCSDNNAVVDAKIEQSEALSSIELDGNRYSYRLVGADACGHRFYEARTEALNGSFVGRSVMAVTASSKVRMVSSRNAKRLPAWEEGSVLSVVADVPYGPQQASPLPEVKKLLCP